MRKTVLMIAMLGALIAATATPAAAKNKKVDRIHDVQTVLAVRIEADFPLASLMRATCQTVTRIEHRDGSATEIQDCRLTDEPVMIPAFQGVPPTRAFVHEDGACLWHSDYWFAVAELDVMAESFRYRVTPSGHVHVVSEYPAVPLTCE
jgi:hypothetical protein